MSDTDYENAKFIRDMALHNAVKIATPGTSPEMVVAAAKLFESFLKGETSK